MNVESDESVLEEVLSEEDESEGDELAETVALKNQEREAMEEEEDGLKVESIDRFWLQRRVSEYESDAEKAQELSEKILAVLQNVDEVGVSVCW